MPTWTPPEFSKELRRRLKAKRGLVLDACFEVALRGEAAGPVVAEYLGLVDRGTYAQRFRARRTRRGAELRNDAPHAAVIEFGRRPGARWPPQSAILGWIRRKGIDVSALADVRIGKRRKKRGAGWTKGRRQGVRRGQKQLAFLIARAIGTRGLPAHAVFRRHLIPKMTRWFRLELARIVKEKV